MYITHKKVYQQKGENKQQRIDGGKPNASEWKKMSLYNEPTKKYRTNRNISNKWRTVRHLTTENNIQTNPASTTYCRPNLFRCPYYVSSQICTNSKLVEPADNLVDHILPFEHIWDYAIGKTLSHQYTIQNDTVIQLFSRKAYKVK